MTQLSSSISSSCLLFIFPAITPKAFVISLIIIIFILTISYMLSIPVIIKLMTMGIVPKRLLSNTIGSLSLEFDY